MDSLLRTHIDQALFSLGIPKIQYSLDRPKDLSFGDVSTNVALIAAKELGKSPLEVAQSIASFLEKDTIETVSGITIAAPGFINFHADRMVFVATIKEILERKEGWGVGRVHEGKTILVEHSSPNLFKPFHVGHLMNNTIGESIVRLARATGAQVKTMSFPSDISLGVAKALFILLEKYGPTFVPTNVSILGDAYVEGTKRFEEDVLVQDRIKEIANNLYQQIPSVEYDLFLACKKFNMEYFEDVVARLGSHFDSYIYESEAGEVGKEIVKKHTPSVFAESEGAVVYIPDESRKDFNTSVFINSQGNPTYEAKDLGLIDMKFAQYSPDLSIFITDVQQVPHFKAVLDAAGKINSIWEERSLHRFHGRMSFKGQKMSSRLGGVPLVEDIVQTVVDEVSEKNGDVSKDAAQSIAIGALKFVILRAAAGKNIDFDPETSLSFEGGSGPYLQYTAVRAKALLEKAGTQQMSPELIGFGEKASDLERILLHYPSIVARAGSEWAPHHIVTYLLELSQAFNSWYGNTKIIDTENLGMAYNLAIVSATRQTIENGLSLLGITLPEKM